MNIEILNKIVKKNVNQHSTVITDQWRGYNGLTSKGFFYLKVNHSIGFVDSNNPLIHTQNIENLWKQLRKFLNNKTNYSRKTINFYLKEFIYRNRIIKNKFDYFINNLKYFQELSIENNDEIIFSDYEIVLNEH